MANTDPHTFEAVPDRVAQWVETMAVRVANRMREGGRAPFHAAPDAEQTFKMFNTPVYGPNGELLNHPLWNEDGSPTNEPRTQLAQERGAQGYADLVRWMVKMRSQRGAMVLDHNDLASNDQAQDGTGLPPFPAKDDQYA